MLEVKASTNIHNEHFALFVRSVLSYQVKPLYFYIVVLSMFCEEGFTDAVQVNWWVIDLKYKLLLVQCDCVPKIYQPIYIVTRNF